jgi:hypothetical protein
MKFLNYLNEDVLAALYDLQNSTVEHKFPIRYGLMYTFEMAAGDVFREMTIQSPAYGYIFEKIERLKQFQYINDADIKEESEAKKELDTLKYKYYKAALNILTAQTDAHKEKYLDRFPIMDLSLSVLHLLTKWFDSENLNNKLPVINAVNALEKEINAFFKQNGQSRAHK